MIDQRPAHGPSPAAPESGSSLPRPSPWEEASAALRPRRHYDLAPFESPLANVEGRWPDFMLIGAQKCGTTWLYRNLSYHPEVWMPLVKEPFYYALRYIPSTTQWERGFLDKQILQAQQSLATLTRSKEAVDRHRECLTHMATPSIDDAWYRRIFAFGGVGQMTGEASTFTYLLPRQVIAMIAQQNPRVRLILMLRDPIERAWSHIRMLLQRGDPATVSLVNDGRFSALWTFVGASNYPEALNAWRCYFPDSQILFLNFDDLMRQPFEVLRQVCDFLHITWDARFFPRDGSQIHAGVSRPMPPELYGKLRHEMRGLYDALLAMLPDIAGPWWSQHFGEEAVWTETPDAPPS